MTSPSLWLLAIGLCATARLLSADQSGHWFCHELDCPDFKVVRSVDEDFELREYSAESLWVSTNVSDVHYDAAVRTGFLKLFEYISGANEHGWKIEMTAPVRTKLIAGAGPFCEDTFIVSFFLPFEYQEGRKQPPAPNRDSLFIEATPAMRYWVYSYPGFTSESKVLEMASRTLGRLDKMGEHYNAEVFYASNYDPPFRLINRHNEVWIPVPESPSATKAAASAKKGTTGRIIAKTSQSANDSD